MTRDAMRVLRDPRAVRRQVRSWRAAGESVALVPTMGFLHAGHLSLLARAKRRGRRVVLSIYVNPTQFAPHEDLATYPRDLRRDLGMAREAEVDLCFCPETLYGEGFQTQVRVTGLETVLEGASRPDHFAGVTLVVLKLLHIVEPDALILGQKDVQQAVILERMVRDLDLAVRVERGPIVREADGLAMSSRNIYLTPVQRAAAPVLHRALQEARSAARIGRASGPLLRSIERAVAAESEADLDYVAAVDATSLQPVSKLSGRVILAIAARFGRTRLIDNEEFSLREVSS